MKSLIKYLTFITTTLILVIGVPLSSFAYSIQSFQPVSSRIYHAAVDPNTGVVQTVDSQLTLMSPSAIPSTLDTSWILCDGKTTDTRQYPYYLVHYGRVPSGNSIDSEATILCNYDLTDLEGFNSIAFNCGVFAPRYDYELYNQFSITVNDEPVDLPYTVTYEYGDQYTNLANGTVMIWRSVRLYFYFGDIFNYNTANIKIYVNSYLPYANGQMRYCFGMSDLIAKVVTQEEYVAEISQSVANVANKIDQTNTQLGIIGSKADEIKSEVTEIVDVLTQEMSPEQQQQVQDVLDNIDTRAEVEDAVIDDFNNVFESFDNIDYDPYGDSFKTTYNDTVNSIWNSSFLTFWNTFWLEPTLVILILLVLGFSIAGFVLYGVR